MAKRSATVRQLAEQAGLELDEVIVSLWDSGIDYVDSPNDAIRSSDVARAKRTLGVATPRELRSAQYWREALGLSDEAFSSVLERLNIVIPKGAAQLPRGAVAKLRKHLRGRPLRPSQPFREEVKTEAPPFVWTSIGRDRDVRHLEADEVRRIHDQLVLDFAASDDPIDPPGPRDEHLLESAVFRPRTALGSQDKYPTVEMAAAALTHSLVLDHPFHNGNKRTALVSMLVLLDENGLVITCDEEALFKFVLRVAQHRLVQRDADNRADREVLEMTRWIDQNSRRVEKGERPIPWRRLKRILGAFGCQWEPAHVGNRMNLRRVTQERTRLGRVRERTLQTQVHYRDDGTELERNSLNKIRHELELDEEHGVDSKSFYEADVELAAEDFIAQYRKVLLRLARL